MRARQDLLSVSFHWIFMNMRENLKSVGHQAQLGFSCRTKETNNRYIQRCTSMVILTGRSYQAYGEELALLDSEYVLFASRKQLTEGVYSIIELCLILLVLAWKYIRGKQNPEKIQNRKSCLFQRLILCTKIQTIMTMLISLMLQLEKTVAFRQYVPRQDCYQQLYQ